MNLLKRPPKVIRLLRKQKNTSARKFAQLIQDCFDISNNSRDRFYQYEFIEMIFQKIYGNDFVISTPNNNPIYCKGILKNISEQLESRLYDVKDFNPENLQIGDILFTDKYVGIVIGDEYSNCKIPARILSCSVVDLMVAMYDDHEYQDKHGISYKNGGFRPINQEKLATYCHFTNILYQSTVDIYQYGKKFRTMIGDEYPYKIYYDTTSPYINPKPTTCEIKRSDVECTYRHIEHYQTSFAKSSYTQIRVGKIKNLEYDRPFWEAVVSDKIKWDGAITVNLIISAINQYGEDKVLNEKPEHMLSRYIKASKIIEQSEGGIVWTLRKIKDWIKNNHNQ